MSDALSRLLGVSGVQGALWSRARLSGAYGVRASAPRAIFHAPVKGRAWIRSGDILESLAPGDVAVLARGASHDITDVPERACQRIVDYPMERERGLPTVHNGPESDFELLCGTFSVGSPADRWLVEPLPELFVVRGGERAATFVTATLGLLEAELAEGGLGSSLLADRLLEVLVIHVFRSWMQHARIDRGWAAGMSDPQLSRVLVAVHADPSQPWTLERMARTAGMSRTRFVARFRERIGEAPKSWLTHWRIAVARRALRDGADVGRAAAVAGYANEASFSRAFKRVVGVAPGTWRRA